MTTMTVPMLTERGHSSAFVIVPAYNERLVLPTVLGELLATSPQLEVVVVDDGSSDGTYEVGAAYPVHVLRHAVNLGQGAALKTGIDYAVGQGAEIIVTFDADGQMDPAEIQRLIEPVALGECDVALGTRFGNRPAQGITIFRRVLLRAAVRFTRISTGLPLSDAHNGFRAMNRKAAQAIGLTQNRMAHASEIISNISRARLRWVEVPVTIRYTPYSKRKGQTFFGAFDVLVDLLGRPVA